MNLQKTVSGTVVGHSKVRDESHNLNDIDREWKGIPFDPFLFLLRSLPSLHPVRKS